MANIQSPPGFLSITELLVTLRSKLFVMELFNIVEGDKSSSEKIDNCTVYAMHDCPDVYVLDEYLHKDEFPVRIQLVYIQFTIHNDNEEQQSFKVGTCVKEYPDFDHILRDIIIMQNLRRCRDLLSGKYLKAYVLYNYAYHELPAEYWSYDKNWYRLLLDGCALGPIAPIGDFFGSVYFKTEDAIRCTKILPNKQPAASYFSQSHHSSSLINLDTYTTPWLQVLAAIYDKYGKEELGQVTKDSVVYFITDYVNKHELDIAQSDFSFLAKSMRLAEQKEGKKYHAKRKLKKSNIP